MKWNIILHDYLFIAHKNYETCTVVNNSASQQALNLYARKSGSICIESHFHAVTDDLQGETLSLTVAM